MRETAPRSSTRPSYVLIGASTGGHAALLRIFRDIPADFPGAILIVLHVAADSTSWMPQRLMGISRIPVKVAENGERIRQGTAYIAPAGSHMLTRRGRVALDSGPKEHHVRPAIDVLFRSAAREFGSRAIGVILTGLLRDGSIGLRAVRRAGGVTIVQDPDYAEEGDMPRNAMTDLAVDYCLELSEIGPTLDLMVRRAGPYRKGVLETGLASSIRLMKNRARLLAKLVEQSHRNPRTERFLYAEVSALQSDIEKIQRMIPVDGDQP